MKTSTNCRCTVRQAFSAMGTRFEFVLVGAGDQCRLRAAAEAALAEVQSVEREWSRFRRDSFVHYLERHAWQRPVRLDPEQAAVFALCQTVAKDSGGAFDVTVAPLVQARGFTRKLDSAAAWKPASGSVQFDPVGPRLRLMNPGVRFDFGAVGKGIALDRAKAVLQDLGVNAAFLHGGTSCLLAWGEPPGEDTWQVAIQRPDGPGWLARVSLNNMALAISGQHRQRGGDGVGSHIVDPRGSKEQHPAELTVVMHSSAAWADAWSTATLVLGEARTAAGTCLIYKSGLEPQVSGPHHRSFRVGPAEHRRLKPKEPA